MCAELTLSSTTGIEWDSLVVALLALYKFVSLPVRLTARFLFRVWTIYARIVQALGVEGFQSTVTSAVVVLVCMWAVQATYTWSHASIDAPSKMDMDVPQVDVAATVPHHSILDALVERVTSLESAVANLASAATAAETPVAILELEKKVLSMEHQLNTVTMRVDNESKRYGDAIDDTAETLLATKERLEAVAGTMHTLVQDVSQMAAAKGHLVDYEKLAEGIIKKVANNELESLVAALRDSGAVSSENTENDSMMSRENIIAVIREELRTVEAEMERREQAFLAKQQQQPQQTSDRLTVDETQIEAHMVQAIIDRALARFDADRLALPDYALRSAGARILRHRGLTSKIFIDDYGYEKAAKRGGANGGGLVGWVQRLVMPVRKLPVPPPSANPPEIVIDVGGMVL